MNKLFKLIFVSSLGLALTTNAFADEKVETKVLSADQVAELLNTKVLEDQQSEEKNVTIDTERQKLGLQALTLLGTPYRYGGSDFSEGFDCSGLIKFVYENTLNVSLPRTARDIAKEAQPISKSQLKVGDLVFFNTTGKKYSHVGLYIGKGQFVHAPSSGKKVRVESLDNSYFKRRFTGAFSLMAKM